MIGAGWRALRGRQPGASVARILWWHFLHFLCYLWVAPCFRYRAWGVENIPETGPILLVANHQSFLDPILVGLAGHSRQFYAMARSTLWHNRVLAWIINSLNAVPVDRGAADMAAMKRCIAVLQAGHALLVFPEGTRTLDGTVRGFASGTMLLIRRARPMVVPVAIEGSFQAWPRSRKLPRARGRVGVMYGKPIPAEELIGQDAEAALEKLRQTIETMRQELAGRLSR